MLLITFQVGNDRYGIEAQQIEEILPLVEFKNVPRAPAGIVGILNYHGRPVPVLDLTELATGEPSRSRMGTRIFMVKYPMAAGESHHLALIAEHVTDTMRRKPEDFRAPGVVTAYAPYLGDVVPDRSGIVQMVTLKELLPEGIRKYLFQDFTNYV